MYIICIIECYIIPKGIWVFKRARRLRIGLCALVGQGGMYLDGMSTLRQAGIRDKEALQGIARVATIYSSSLVGQLLPLCVAN